MEILCRTPEELQTLSGPTDVAVKSTSKVAANSIVFSTDGKLMAVVAAEGISVQDTASRAERRRLEAGSVQAAAFSPAATFLTTYQRPSKDAAGAQEKNLKVWRLADGECVLALHQRSFRREQAPRGCRDSWPSVQFTADEGLAFHQVANAVNIYAPADFGAGVSRRMPLKGLAGFAACPAPGSTLLAAYVPESKGQPGFIALYDHSAKLYWLAADGSDEQAVPLPKAPNDLRLNLSESELQEGPIHDVQWTPKGDHFLTVAGFMPAKVTLFTDRCQPKAENGVTLEWSPEGRHLLVATTAPRLRVDNGIQVFKYDGTLVAREARDVLLEAAWVPARPGAYEDRPQSPRAAAGAASSSGGGGGGGGGTLPQPPARAAGYVPPHLRGRPEAAKAAAAAFSLARDPSDRGGKIGDGASAGGGGSGGGGNLPPGAAPPQSKSAAKNAKRRAAAKKKADGADGYDWVVVDAQHSPLNHAALAAHLTAAAAGGAAAVVRVGGPHDVPGIQQALDLGAAGIMVPTVNSAEDVQRCVAAARYPTAAFPAGMRSISWPVRPQLGRDVNEYLRAANEEVETRACLEHVEAVVGVAGLDAAFVGPVDLSHSLGLHLKPPGFPSCLDSPAFAAALARIAGACRAAGVAAGTFAVGHERAAASLAAGYPLLAVGTDVGLLGAAAEASLSGLRRLRSA
eukprot:scaffold4.g4853.t1